MGDPEPIRDEDLFMTTYLDLGLHRPVGGWGAGQDQPFRLWWGVGGGSLGNCSSRPPPL